MGWLLLGVVVVAALAWFVVRALYVEPPSKRTSTPAPYRPSMPPQPARPVGPSLFDFEAETARLEREVEAMMPDLMREVEAKAAAMMPEIEAEAARQLAEIRREEEERAAAESFDDEEDEPEPRRVIWREDYVPKEDEARYLTRDESGLPTLRLADAGDRLGIWSPLDGGALINPKGPGLRQRLGLCTTYARGSKHHATAYRAADLAHGHWVDLKREPDNPHDGNAVAIYAQDTGARVGYVGRGRAVSVARRMDAGEDMAGVTIWGPGRGGDDRSTLVLIGRRADLAAMLS